MLKCPRSLQLPTGGRVGSKGQYVGRIVYSIQGTQWDSLVQPRFPKVSMPNSPYIQQGFCIGPTKGNPVYNYTNRTKLAAQYSNMFGRTYPCKEAACNLTVIKNYLVPSSRLCNYRFMFAKTYLIELYLKSLVLLKPNLQL